MRLLLVALVIPVLLVGCKAAEPEPASPTAAPVAQPRAWPTLFMEPAVLVAREVTIEGPAGLLDHVALSIDQNIHDYSARTVPEGLLQELTFKPGNEGGVLRCFLDGLELAAEVRVRVLERPGDVPLSVVARGAVFWQKPGQPEFRGDSLRLAETDSR